MLPELSPWAFVAGLMLVYAALAISVAIVFRSRRVELSRRRPDTIEAHSSNLTKLTNQAVQTLNKGVRSTGSGLLSREKLEEAGLKKQPGDYLLMAGAVTFVAVVLGFLLAGPGLAVVTLVLTPISLIVFLNLLVARRRKKFDEQVPDTLQMFAGGLRAGHSLLRSVDAAAQENEAPMTEELNRVVNETRIGRDLGDSLNDVARRTANEDFGAIATAIDIHREVGGDLAQVLDHVGETIRDRNQIRGQIRALSAEGKMSAIVLMALPIVMFAGLTALNPLYQEVFLRTLPGYGMIAAVLLLLVGGGFWLTRIIKPKF